MISKKVQTGSSSLKKAVLQIDLAEAPGGDLIETCPVTHRRRACTNASRCRRRVSKSFLRASQGPKISESLSLDTHLVLDVVSTSDVVWQLVRASIRHDEHLRARLGRSVRVGGRQERRVLIV